MMKHFHIRSFHASHQLNLQPMDNEREYLPWMSDLLVSPYICIASQHMRASANFSSSV
jgi:hypothetical protein